MVNSCVYHNYNVPMQAYNPFLVYCRELAPSTISLTGDRAQGDDSKHDLHYTVGQFTITFAHSYTSYWQLGLLETSGEETILREKYAGCDLLSA